MTPPDRPTRIVFALFPGVTQLDFTGPHQLLAITPGMAPVAASMGGAVIESHGLQFCGLEALEDIADCDVLCVPGGAVLGAISDEAFLAQLRRLAGTARYVTSVCTGSLLLAAAGLLQGRRAACHWAFRDQLAKFGAIPDEARVVRDGDILTGGGITAGIDFALALIAELAGERTAQMSQLMVEYAPAPPFQSGRPETAPAEVLAAAQAFSGPMMAAQAAAIEAAAARVMETA